MNRIQDEVFRDPLSGLLFHTTLTIPTLKTPYHLCGTGTSGFFTVGYYSTPSDLHESISRHMNLTHLYGKPLELNEKVHEIQRLLITSQRQVLFLMQMTQDIEYSEFIAFFEVQLLAQHRALSDSSVVVVDNPIVHQTKSLTTNDPPATPQSRGKITTTTLTQHVHDNLQLFLNSFPRHQYRKGDRILFFQGESHLRIEIDCPHQYASPHQVQSSIGSTAHPTHFTTPNPQQQHQQQYQPPQQSPQPVPIPSDNILCQHIRSIFITSAVYPFDLDIESLYCRTPNHLPQPSLQRLPLVLLHSLMSGVSIQQQQVEYERRMSFSDANGRLSSTSIRPHSTTGGRPSHNSSTALTKGHYDDDDSSSSSSSSSSSDDDSDGDDDDDKKGNDPDDLSRQSLNDQRLSYEAQRSRQQRAMMGSSDQDGSNRSHFNTSVDGQTQLQQTKLTGKPVDDLVGSLLDQTTIKNDDPKLNQSQRASFAHNHSLVDSSAPIKDITGTGDQSSFGNLSKVNQNHQNLPPSGLDNSIIMNSNSNNHNDDEFSSDAPTLSIAEMQESGKLRNSNTTTTTTTTILPQNPTPQPLPRIQPATESRPLPPLILPLVMPEHLLRSSYVYLEKPNIIGLITQWKRRHLAIRGHYLHCSHHHLLEPTISLNLQTCKMYVDREHRLVEFDSLPILNSPNSSLHSTLKLTQSQTSSLPQSALSTSQSHHINNTSQQTTMPPNLNRTLSSQSYDQSTNNPSPPGRETIGAPLDTSISKLFTDLIDFSSSSSSSTQLKTQHLGSHLTRVPDHLCSRNSYHIIFVIVDETSGYQLRISADPSLAKRWLRDLITVALLAGAQSHLELELMKSTQMGIVPPVAASWARNYLKLTPYLAHYYRDPRFLLPLQRLENEKNNNPTAAQAPTSGSKRTYAEVLPEHAFALLNSKQNQFVQLTMTENEKVQNGLNLDNFRQTYESAKSSMYNDSSKPSSQLSQSQTTNGGHGTTNSTTTLPIQPTPMKKPLPQPTVNEQLRVVGAKQAPAASAKSYFEALKKEKEGGNDNKKNQHDEGILPPPSHLGTEVTSKLTTLEMIMAVIILFLSLAYLYQRAQNGIGK